MFAFHSERFMLAYRSLLGSNVFWHGVVNMEFGSNVFWHEVVNMEVLGAILGLVGLGVSVFAIVDNRRQRNQREKAVIAARETLARVNGLLIGIKPAISSTHPAVEKAIDDGLSAIAERRKIIDDL